MKQREGWVQENGRSRPVVYLDGLPGVPAQDAVLWTLVLVVIGLLVMVWGAAELSSWLANGSRAGVTLGEAGLAMARLGAYETQLGPGLDPGDPATPLAGPTRTGARSSVRSPCSASCSGRYGGSWGPARPSPCRWRSTPTPVNNPRTVRQRSRRDWRSSQSEADAQQDLAGPDFHRGSGPTRWNEDAGDPEPVPAVVTAAGWAAPESAPSCRWPRPPPAYLVGRPDGRRLVLGRIGENLVAADPGQAVIAFGPTGSGKTASLAVPAILEWDGPALVCTSKPDLVHLTWDTRSDRGGQSWLFDPSATMKRPASSYSEPPSDAPLRLVAPPGSGRPAPGAGRGRPGVAHPPVGPGPPHGRPDGPGQRPRGRGCGGWRRGHPGRRPAAGPHAAGRGGIRAAHGPGGRLARPPRRAGRDRRPPAPRRGRRRGLVGDGSGLRPGHGGRRLPGAVAHHGPLPRSGHGRAPCATTRPRSTSASCSTAGPTPCTSTPCRVRPNSSSPCWPPCCRRRPTPAWPGRRHRAAAPWIRPCWW